MLSAGQTLDMTAIDAIFRVVKTAHETQGKSFEMEWELLAKSGGAPVHIHPFSKESYKVIDGQLEVSINGRWLLLLKGEELTVDERVPHTFRNPSNSVTRVYNTHSPAMQFDRYFEGLGNIVSKLSHGNKQKLKMNLNAATHLSMLMKKYNREIVSVNPPGFVVSILNLVGKLRGVKV